MFTSPPSRPRRSAHFANNPTVAFQMQQGSNQAYLSSIPLTCSPENFLAMASLQRTAAASPLPITAVQNAHRRAAIGISLRHSGHLRVDGSGGGSLRERAINALIGNTTKKYTAAAMSTNEMTAFSRSPIRN